MGFCGRSSSEELVCMTTAFRAAAATDDDDDIRGPIVVTIDGIQLDLNRTLFTYTKDPVVTDVQPSASFISFVYCVGANNYIIITLISILTKRNRLRWRPLRINTFLKVDSL